MYTPHRCVHCGLTGRVNGDPGDTASPLPPAGWRWSDSHHDGLLCPACTRNCTVATDDVEWVAGHFESHGQLLVRGDSLAQILARADIALALDPWQPLVEVSVRPIRIGWWRAVACRCLGHPTAGHPRWHYLPADAGEPDAFAAAELRLALTPPAPTAGAVPATSRRTAA